MKDKLTLTFNWRVFSLDKLDCLERALTDTQETVRDFELYSRGIQDEEVSQCFKDLAFEEGKHAQRLSELLDKYKDELTNIDYNE